jgi:hypothetical protein
MDTAHARRTRNTSATSPCPCPSGVSGLSLRATRRPGQATALFCLREQPCTAHARRTRSRTDAWGWEAGGEWPVLPFRCPERAGMLGHEDDRTPRPGRRALLPSGTAVHGSRQTDAVTSATSPCPCPSGVSGLSLRTTRARNRLPRPPAPGNSRTRLTPDGHGHERDFAVHVSVWRALYLRTGGAGRVGMDLGFSAMSRSTS